DHDEVLAEDRSVASGRPMEQIKSGKGRSPKPFMLTKGGRAKSKADAVWHSNKGEAEKAAANDAEPDTAERRKAERKNAAAKGAEPDAVERQRAEPKHLRGHIPAFVAPQLAKLVDRPPNSDGCGHELKLDGYRLLLRVENGKATLKTRKGLDWT